MESDDMEETVEDKEDGEEVVIYKYKNIPKETMRL